jgi:hypothetical protein
MQRLEKELDLVRKQFGAIRVSSALEWVIVERFLLPVKRFNRPHTELLHFIRPGYPQTAPDNFLVPAGLRTLSGGELGAWYGEGASHFDLQWGVFSWHASAWNPHADLMQGDNLCSFLMSIRRELETYPICN